MFIEHQRYKRNALIFNICFVFNQDVNTADYVPVVKKLAAYMIQLEVLVKIMSYFLFLSFDYSLALAFIFIQGMLQVLILLWYFPNAINLKISNFSPLHMIWKQVFIRIKKKKSSVLISGATIPILGGRALHLMLANFQMSLYLALLTLTGRSGSLVSRIFNLWLESSGF